MEEDVLPPALELPGTAAKLLSVADSPLSELLCGDSVQHVQDKLGCNVSRSCLVSYSSEFPAKKKFTLRDTRTVLC